MSKLATHIGNIVSLFVLIAYMALSFGCESIRLTNNGVKKPRIETPSSLNKYLRNKNLENEINLIPKFEYLHSIILSGISPTTVYVFDKNGEEIQLPGASNKCAPEPSLFIKDLRSDKQYLISNSLFLDSLHQWVYTEEGKDVDLKEINVDFYIVIFWAVWPGEKVFQRDIMGTINAFKDNTNAKIKLILINLDKQDIWGKENLSKVRFTKKEMNVSFGVDKN